MRTLSSGSKPIIQRGGTWLELKMGWRDRTSPVLSCPCPVRPVVLDGKTGLLIVAPCCFSSGGLVRSSLVASEALLARWGNRPPWWSCNMEMGRIIRGRRESNIAIHSHSSPPPRRCPDVSWHEPLRSCSLRPSSSPLLTFRSPTCI
jgi:hypothetical protein